MYKLIISTKFRKDLKRMERRGFDRREMESALNTLCEGDPLPASFRDHALVGNYKGCRECHLKPDWLLIYDVDGDKLILAAIRTGTHAELFDI